MDHANICALYIFIASALILLTVSLKRYIEMDKWLYRLILCLVITTVGAALSDGAAWLADGQKGTYIPNLIMMFNSMFYLFITLPPMFWYLIIVYLRKREAAFTSFRTSAILVIYTFTVIAVILNILNNSLFYVDANNYYHRGVFYYYIHIFSFLFFFVSIVRVYRHRSEYATEIIAAKYFWIAPLIGAILQTLFYGLNLYIAGITISIMMLYIGLMTRNSRLDYLTGIHNRQYLEIVLNTKMHSRFAAIMIDINNFKSINDRFGHVLGDEVLISVANILKSSIKKNDFAARYGGDEFIIIIDSDQRRVLEMVVDRINHNLSHFNKVSRYPFNISLGMGFEIYQPQLFKSKHDFIKCIDKHMYLDKESKPNQLNMKVR